MGGGIDQSQLDALFTAALEAAIGRIEKDGSFFPLLFELRANGTIQNVAVLETGAIEGHQSVLDRLADLLRPRAMEGTILAAAIVHLGAEGSAIEVRLRAPNYAGNVLVPYDVTTSGIIRRKRELTLGEFSVTETANEVF